MLFWIIFILLIANTVYSADRGIRTDDRNPGFVMDQNIYRQLQGNVIWASVMPYVMPAFAVVSVLLVLNRDYGDGFFEIERAGGVKPWKYYLGRLTALVSVNGVVGLIAVFTGYHLYYFTRGGYPGLSLTQFFSESTVRILRMYVLMALPVLILFIGITYFTGSLLHNGFAGGVAGIAYVLLTYLFRTVLQFRMSLEYTKYIMPSSFYMQIYWDVFHDPDPVLNRWNEFNILDVLHWYSYILGGAIVFLGLAYVFTRRRKT